MNDADTTRTPITICWHCDRALDAATEYEEYTGPPTPGAISLCMYCGAVAVFVDELALRPPTTDELDDLGSNLDFQRQYVTFMWARQHVMLKENVLRDRSDPDR